MRFHWTPEQIRELSIEEITQIRKFVMKEQKDLKRQAKLAEMRARRKR